MTPRATPPSPVQPVQPSAVIAELFAGMPIVLLVRALYEAYIEPASHTGSSLPSHA